MEFARRTKIIATIGPASSSPEVMRQLLLAGMDVARLNFSHGSHEDHALVIQNLRQVSRELNKPVTILQDLQGPKVRVGQLAGGELSLKKGSTVVLVPQERYSAQPATIPIDYPHVAAEAVPGMAILLADGLMELKVLEVLPPAVHCEVVEGGIVKSRKGVNFPELHLRLPALTAKDQTDLAFGLAHDVDWISLSFVRNAADLRQLKQLFAPGKAKPVIAKIEKPQAINHLDEILQEADGMMVARGDLGVEMSPEKVPMLQKQVIEACNRAGKPVITATQMLESMIFEPRPTRAEASDVANAIVDGTDAIMLSGESAIGAYPVRAVQMMDKIAREVEARIEFKSYPPAGCSNTHALSRAVNVMEDIVRPCCIVLVATSGETARAVAADRLKTNVLALTTNSGVFHSLNLLWGIRPVLVEEHPVNFEGLVGLAEKVARQRNLAAKGDHILVLGGIPAATPHGTNFVQIHTLEL